MTGLQQDAIVLAKRAVKGLESVAQGIAKVTDVLAEIRDVLQEIQAQGTPRL